MNKYNIKDFLGDKIKNYKSTFKKTSYDKYHKEYLCQDESTEVYDFDKFIKENYDESNLLASPDAIYVGNKKVYFVEFKNSIPSDIDTSNIKSKFKEGTKILKGILSDFKPKDVQFIFCVVYKKPATSAYFYSSHIEKNMPKFELNLINKELDDFYNDIITEDIDFFKEEFEQLKC